MFKKMKISTYLFIFISLTSCGINKLDSYSEGKINRKELVLVRTDNNEISDSIMNELLFGWISPGSRREPKVEIESIDGISTEIVFFRTNQQYAVLPGIHELKVNCQLYISKDKEGESETYYNEDVLNIDLEPGYEYRFEATDENFTCGFEVEKVKAK